MTVTWKIGFGFLGTLLLVATACAAGGPSGTSGYGRGAERTRVDFFDPRSNRTGYAIIEGDRIDFFDTRSRRTGYGRIESGGTISTFDLKRNRTGIGNTR